MIGKNLRSKLKSHETNSEHCMNISAWVELEIRLQKSITIDKDVQNRKIERKNIRKKY